MKVKCLLFVCSLSVVATLIFSASGCRTQTKTPIDNAGGRTPEDFPELAIDVFKPMDGGIALSAEEIKGRNTWNLWCGGDEQFWDRVARDEFGFSDLLKTIDSRRHDERFQTMGLINEPGYQQATKPDKYGLWIDEPVTPEPDGIDPKVYGRPTGVMGFRLFDNPDFTGDAIKKWDPEKYNDPKSDYSTQKGLIRPYRVGVSCGACHIAFNPCNPPASVNHPKWENLASAIGNQYLVEGAVFAANVKEGGFFHEMIKTQPRGTADTSRIATDHINNPNVMNPIFALGARLSVAHEETMAEETLLLPGEQTTMAVPHILKDGADSVGVVGASTRVYVNIGMFSQHWLEQHQALIGLTSQKPFSIKLAQANSVYWLATQQKVGNIAAFFKKLQSFRLEDAPNGRDHITKDQQLLARGGNVFARNCASCHSSKRPPADVKDDDEWFATEVAKPDFRENNFFSDDVRYPVTKIKTNAGRASGTNAKRGHIWNNFSSETYKNAASVGNIEVWNPYTGMNENFAIPGGGPGYYRTPSLISCWSSAPFFHNNALGKFTGDPSVAGRLEAFDDATQKLLWPEKRLGTNSIWRTSRECQLQINSQYIPEPLRTLLKPQIDPDGFFRIGHIPEGTPVNLLANIDTESSPADLAKLCLSLKAVLLKIEIEHLDDAAAKKVLAEIVAPALWKVSKCPDFVEDRGHYYGTELPDADKLALIEYLKTL